MSLPKTMKAAVVTAHGAPLDIREVPVPAAALGQVAMRVRASGVCHIDLHAVSSEWPVKPQLPFIPGQKGVGEVDPAGELQRLMGGVLGCLIRPLLPG